MSIIHIPPTGNLPDGFAVFCDFCKNVPEGMKYTIVRESDMERIPFVYDKDAAMPDRSTLNAFYSTPLPSDETPPADIT